MIDLSLLPPCESELMLHCEKPNFVAKIWKSDLNSVTGDIEWVEQIFADNVEDSLIVDEYEKTYNFDSDIESHSETDMI